jgi:sugar transferase EpsL
LLSRDVIRRTIEVTLALAGLILLAPIFLAIAAAVALTAGRPVFVLETGRDSRGRAVAMLRFRNGRGASAPGSPDRFGRWLRRTSLDCLPGYISLLRGECAIDDLWDGTIRS